MHKAAHAQTGCVRGLLTTRLLIDRELASLPDFPDCTVQEVPA